MEMTKVTKCEMSDCSYNADKECHAMAITIGDAVHPKCDTFFQSMIKGGGGDCVAGVGAYKVSSCVFNASFECQASGISVGYRESEPDCLMFSSS